jgi:gliding motility-associated-like protein
MKQTLQTKSLLTAILLFVFSLGALAQTPPVVPFDFTVVPTAAFCAGQGQLALNVPAGLNPLGTITFQVYAGTSATGAPVAVISTPPYVATSLAEGPYTVVGQFAVGGSIISTVTHPGAITTTVDDPVFTPVSRNVHCNNDGVITVNTIFGAARSYRLTGAATRPAQTSPVFENLGIGRYTVIVTDVCGNDRNYLVIIDQAETRVEIGPYVYPYGRPPVWELPSCNSISVQHRIFTIGEQEIFYPVRIEYIVTAPDGTVSSVFQDLDSPAPPANPNNYTFITTPLPFYNDQDYSYDFKLTDNCNNVFWNRGNIIRQAFSVSPEVIYGHCEENVNLNLFNWSGETTVHFTSPAGFDAIAATYNPEHPVHSMANGSPIVYGNHFPEGAYSAVVTNCGDGRSVTINFNVDIPEPDVIFNGTTDCSGVNVTISGSLTKVPTNFVSVTLIQGPPGYVSGTEGNDWSSGIDPMDPTKFSWSGGAPAGVLILGTYQLRAVDECGNVFIKDVPIIPVLEGGIEEIVVNNLPGCEPDYGSVRVSDIGPAPLEQIFAARILSGPPAWTALNPDPVDITANIASPPTFLTINNLPEGDYIFELTDGCGPKPWPVTVVGYEAPIDRVDVVFECGSVAVTPVREITNNAGAYYIQKKIQTGPDAGKWSAPGYDPNAPGGLYDVYDPTPLQGQTTPPEPGLNTTTFRYNADRLSAPTYDPVTDVYTPVTATYTAPGEYRVLEVTFIHGNGHLNGEQCFKEMASFELGSDIVLGDVIFTSVSPTTVNANVIATGFGSLEYRIVSPASEATPFQSSNLFPNLTVGVTYTFAVKNDCEDTDNLEKRAAPQVDPVIAQLGNCVGTEVKLIVTPYIPLYTYEWTKVGETTPVVATEGNLVFPNFSASDAGQYVLRVYYAPDPLLYDTTLEPYTVVAPDVLNAGINNLNNSLCTNAAAPLLNLNTYLLPHPDLGAPDLNGIFTDAAGTEIPGGLFNIASVTTDTVLNFFYTVSDPACPAVSRANIRFNINQSPIVDVNPLSVICEGERILLTATSTTPNVTYSWTTPNGTVTGNVIDIASAALNNAGNYTVTATSANGVCVSAPVTRSITVTALVSAGDDVSVPVICSDATANELNLNDFITASATTGGSFTLGTQDDPGRAFDSVRGTFDTANLVGTFEFIYSVTACGITDTAVITFTINPTPAAPVATVDAAVVCENGTIQLNTPAYAGTGTVTYVWSGPNGFTSALQNPTVPATLAAAGVYSLTLIVDNCTSDPSAPVNVAVTPLPQFSLTGNTVICPTQFTTLSVTPGNFGVGDTNITYQWTLDGNIVSNTNTARVDQLGEYLVTVSNGSCTSPAQPITVTADPDPFTVTLQGDCVNEHFILSITNLTEIGTTQSIVWTGPGTSDATNSPTLDLVGKDPGTYEVVVTNADGCFKQASIIVETTECTIPKGISPNGDNFNNEFDLTNLKVQNLQIFNRYGLQVYEKNNYTKEWYGQSDKGDLPTGTYFYVAKMADRQVTGWVYIQREQ